MSDWAQARTSSEYVGNGGREPELDPHVQETNRLVSIVEVSSWLSPHRTSCVIPHHPSLDNYCLWECAGKTLCRQNRLSGNSVVECQTVYQVGTACPVPHTSQPVTDDVNQDRF